MAAPAAVNARIRRMRYALHFGLSAALNSAQTNRFEINLGRAFVCSPTKKLVNCAGTVKFRACVGGMIGIRCFEIHRIRTEIIIFSSAFFHPLPPLRA